MKIFIYHLVFTLIFIFSAYFLAAQISRLVCPDYVCNAATNSTDILDIK